VAGRRYVDTALGYGAALLGHAPAPVMEAVARALHNGPLPAFAHPAEEAAAAAIAAHTGPLQHVIFTNSGSEAVHLACRAARRVTGRGRIAKFAAGYDGWFDEQAFGNASSSEAALHGNERPQRPGMTLLRFNDQTDTELLFAEHADIAAVLVEPVLAGAGCLSPAPGYLRHLADTTRRHGALVIADEVLMGFRLHAGLASHMLDLDPDIVTLGKVIGSGIAVAAIAGRPEIMTVFTDGRAHRAGTYCGNPLASAAVLATMAALDHSDYPGLLARGDALRAAIVAAFAAAGTTVSTSGYGSVFSLWFTTAAPDRYTTAVEVACPERSLALHNALRRAAALVMPGPFGKIYLSFAHTTESMAALEAAFLAAVPAVLLAAETLDKRQK
jgi:glutamate-1-semialdehyde 2,1-aminomutase